MSKCKFNWWVSKKNHQWNPYNSCSLAEADIFSHKNVEWHKSMSSKYADILYKFSSTSWSSYWSEWKPSLDYGNHLCRRTKWGAKQACIIQSSTVIHIPSSSVILWEVIPSYLPDKLSSLVSEVDLQLSDLATLKSNGSVWIGCENRATKLI